MDEEKAPGRDGRGLFLFGVSGLTANRRLDVVGLVQIADLDADLGWTAIGLDAG